MENFWKCLFLFQYNEKLGEIRKHSLTSNKDYEYVNGRDMLTE